MLKVKIFDKKIVDTEESGLVENFRENFYQYIDRTDERQLYEVFTKITILRIYLDRNDSLIQNKRDELERRKQCDVKPLIKLQFDDISKTNNVYTEDQTKMIDEVMSGLIPNSEHNSWWKRIWERAKKNFDRAAGRK